MIFAPERDRPTPACAGWPPIWSPRVHRSSSSATPTSAGDGHASRSAGSQRPGLRRRQLGRGRAVRRRPRPRQRRRARRVRPRQQDHHHDLMPEERRGRAGGSMSSSGSTSAAPAPGSSLLDRATHRVLIRRITPDPDGRDRRGDRRLPARPVDRADRRRSTAPRSASAPAARSTSTGSSATRDTLPAFTGLPPLVDGSTDLTDGPVVIDNDAVCAALGRAAPSVRPATSARSLHVTLGTGIGCLPARRRPARSGGPTAPTPRAATSPSPRRRRPATAVAARAGSRPLPPGAATNRGHDSAPPRRTKRRSLFSRTVRPAVTRLRLPRSKPTAGRSPTD